MAKKEPVLHWEDVPIHQRGLLKNASRTTREWTAIFEDIMTENELEDSDSEVRDVNEANSYQASQEALSPYRDTQMMIHSSDLMNYNGESREEEEGEDGAAWVRGQVPREIKFAWDEDDVQPSQGTPSPAHRAAIELLRNAHEDQVDVSRTQARNLRELKALLNSQATEEQTFQRKMGRINELVNQHGSVANAIDKALAGGETADLTAISDKLDQFQQALDEAVAETETSKATLLQLMMKVRESGGRRVDALARRVDDLSRPVQAT
jgi:hypothetical protein